VDSSKHRVSARSARALFVVGVLGGVGLGLWHGASALGALWAFGESDTPFSVLLLLVFAGTLPAALLGFWRPQLAARILWGLAACGLATLTPLLAGIESFANWPLYAVGALAWGPGSQALLGTILWFSRRPAQGALQGSENAGAAEQGVAADNLQGIQR
jgi:hypothetical protein